MTSSTKVSLFVTCLNDMLFPGTAKDVVTVLERVGCTIDVPMNQTCCGQMFTNSGWFDEGLKSVRAFVRAFADAEVIVGASGSCVGSVRHQHLMLARESGDQGLISEVEQIVGRTRELSEYLVDDLGVTDVGAHFPHSVTYHPTCHSLRVAKVGDRPLRLLRAVDGITVVDLPQAEECCGFGGTFAVKNPDVSSAMGADKVAHAIESGAEYLVAGDNSCLMHLSGLAHRDRAPLKTIHLAAILAGRAPASRQVSR